MAYFTTEGLTFYVEVTKKKITATGKEIPVEFSKSFKNDTFNLSHVTKIVFINGYTELVVHLKSNAKTYTAVLVNAKQVRYLQAADKIVDEYNNSFLKTMSSWEAEMQRDEFVRKANMYKIQQQKDIINYVKEYKKNNPIAVENNSTEIAPSAPVAPSDSDQSNQSAEIAALKAEVAELKRMLLNK